MIKSQTPQAITVMRNSVVQAALTTTRVMLSGRVSMVSPPPRTALLVLAWPEDNLWALLG